MKRQGRSDVHLERILVSAFFIDRRTRDFGKRPDARIGHCDPAQIIWRCKEISREALINEEIRAKELRVIDTDGTQLGVMSRQEALDISEEKKLDLVCISPKANPPVCKILDYGKYKYELQKKEKEAKKKQKTCLLYTSCMISLYFNKNLLTRKR